MKKFLGLAILLLTVFLSPSTWATERSPQAPAIVLAEIYRSQLDPSAYLISEKYDGVRAVWDGHELRFRSGRLINAPDWFIASLPAEPLDGELWLGRGRFNELSAIVRRAEPVDTEWRSLRYMIFELPGAPGTFAERAEQIKTMVSARKLDWLQAVEQFRLSDRAALGAKFKAVVKAGGEGLMLHRADAAYVTGRSDVLLKLKPLQDAEAVVIAQVPGRGRFSGQLGTLIVESAEGKRFRIGTGFSTELRLHPPAVGTLITYRYQELGKSGIPRFPRYWRVRENF